MGITSSNETEFKSVKGVKGDKGDKGLKGDKGDKGDPGGITLNDLSTKTLYCADGNTCSIPTGSSVNNMRIGNMMTIRNGNETNGFVIGGSQSALNIAPMTFGSTPTYIWDKSLELKNTGEVTIKGRTNLAGLDIGTWAQGKDPGILRTSQKGTLNDYTIIGTRDEHGDDNTAITLSSKNRSVVPGSIEYQTSGPGTHIFKGPTSTITSSTGNFLHIKNGAGNSRLSLMGNNAELQIGEWLITENSDGNLHFRKGNQTFSMQTDGDLWSGGNKNKLFSI